MAGVSSAWVPCPKVELFTYKITQQSCFSLLVLSRRPSWQWREKWDNTEIFNIGQKINALSPKLDVQECRHSFSTKETAISSNCQLRSDLHKNKKHFEINAHLIPHLRLWAIQALSGASQRIPARCWPPLGRQHLPRRGGRLAWRWRGRLRRWWGRRGARRRRRSGRRRGGFGRGFTARGDGFGHLCSAACMLKLLPGLDSSGFNGRWKQWKVRTR